MPTCFVPGCRNTSKNKPADVTFIRIPKSMDQEWFRVVGYNGNPSMNLRICSEHFLNTDFSEREGTRKLKPNVIPSQKLGLQSRKKFVFGIEFEKISIPHDKEQPVETKSKSVEESVCSPVWQIPSTSKDEPAISTESVLTTDKPPTPSITSSMWNILSTSKYEPAISTESVLTAADRPPLPSTSSSMWNIPSTSKYEPSISTESVLTADWPPILSTSSSMWNIPSTSNYEPAIVERVLTTDEPPVPLTNELTTDGLIDEGPSQLKRKHSSFDTTSTASSLKRQRRFINIMHNYSLSPRHYVKQINKETRRAGHFREKLKGALKTSRRRKRKLVHLKQIVENLRKKNFLSTSALSQLEMCIDKIPLAVMKRVVTTYRKGKKIKSHYPPELKTFAMTLQFYSSRAYDYVRRTFNLALPAPSTIRAWLAKVDCEPGFSKPSITSLKMKAANFVKENASEDSKPPLLIALMLDEMSIKKEIVVDAATLKTRGYTDVGSEVDNGELDIATEVLVIMAVAVNGSFKVPIGYFFVNKLTGAEKANLVKEALHQIYDENIKVLSVTCDGLAAHFSMLKELGCDFTDINKLRTHFQHPVDNTDIVVILDVCHMLKLIRNNWANLRKFKDPDGNFVDYTFIEELHKVQEQEGLYLGNKLRSKHLNWKQHIMKVNLAAQMLSSSVADALDFLNEELEVESFQGVKPTSNFIRIVDGLFDLLNSRNPFGKGYKTPLRMENEAYWMPFLQKAMDYLSKCTNLEGTPLYLTKKRTFFIGLIISSTSFLHIYKNIVCTNALVKYILTYKFSQDHLELFFCNIRSRNGWITNPSCQQFIHTYKRLLMHHNLKDADGNCIAQDQTSILPGTASHPKDNVSLTHIHLQRLVGDADVEALQSEFDLDLPLNLSVFAENVVTYIAGYVIRQVQRKWHCAQCLESLLADPADNDYTLKLIQFKSKGGLLLPSSSLRKICFQVEKKIQRIFVLMNHKLPDNDTCIKTLLLDAPDFLTNDSYFPTLTDHIFDTTLEKHFLEKPHKLILIEYVIFFYSKIRLNSLAKRMTASLVGKSIRQTLSKLIIFKHQ